MRFYSIVLSLLIVLFFNACSSKDSTFAQSKKTHTMGNKLEARYYPIDKPVIKDFANHTYPEAYDENGNRHAWKALVVIVGEKYFQVQKLTVIKVKSVLISQLSIIL